MPTLSLRSATQLVQASAAAVQASCAQLIDLSVGSLLRAMLEANTAIGLWMQWLILLTLQATRLSTSQGNDVDTFVGDFTLTRLGAKPSNGQETFTRYFANGTAIVPVGTTTATTDLTQSFVVIADAANSAYSPTLNGYPLADGQASVTVSAQALTAGSASNVGAGAISLITSSLLGVDTVTNASAFTDGTDAESDGAVKVRFQNFIASLSRATDAAVDYAISQVQGGLTWFIAENVPSVGTFTVTVDDGSGAPPSSLLSAVTAAIDPVRPIGSTFTVRGPTVTVVTVSATITAATGFNKTLMIGPIVDAITAYINKLPIGIPVSFTRIIQVIYGATAGIGNVTGVTLNGSTSDVVIPPTGVAKAGVVTIE